MSKALVAGIRTARYDGEKVVTCWRYKALHECDRINHWSEELDAWHNAFWAADHHVRYDCGRREQVSSGRTYPAWFEQQQAQLNARLVADLMPFYEGGVQNDPTPSDNGDPLVPACAEDPTVELGAITTELGVQVDGGSYTRGGAQAGEHGGSRGWWPWGSGHGR